MPTPDPITTSTIALLNGVILILIGWIGVSVRGIFHQLRTLNGRVGVVEEWRKGKEKLDDERHNANEREHGSLRSALEYVTRQGQDLWARLKNHEG